MPQRASDKEKAPGGKTEGHKKNKTVTTNKVAQTASADKGTRCAAYTQATRLAGGPYQFLPLRPGLKKPCNERWPDVAFGPTDFKPRDNIGLKTGECSKWVVDVDLDYLNPTLVDAILPPTKAVFGRATARSSHRLYIAPGTETFSLGLTADLAHLNPNGKAKIIEFFASNHYTMMPGSIHPNGEIVEWDVSNPQPSEVDGTALCTAVRRYAAASLLALTWDQFAGQHNDLCLALAGTLKRQGWRTGEVENFVEAVCSAARDDEHAKLARKRAQHTDKKKKITGATKLREILGDDIFALIADWLGLDAGRPVNLQLSHHALALRFSTDHTNTLRYCEKTNGWLVWNTTHWQADETRHVQYLVRTQMEKITSEQNEITAAVKRLLDKPCIDAVDQLARSDRRHAVAPNDLDKDPMLLNTPDGTVDLCSGQLRPHDPADLITKCTAVGPKGGEPKRWMQFLQEVCNGDLEVVSYLQRAVGYILTGLTQEDALFVFYGPGGNGKGTFMRTLLGILRDYGKTAPLDTFTYTKHTKHSTDIAGLHGARLVVAAETEEGKSFDEQKVKTLTGSDKVSARFLYRDNFEFLPTFKIIISGNNRPHIRNVDDAWRRRLHLVAFNIKYADPNKAIEGALVADTSLSATLKNEWPQILQWAITGCLAWQRTGLAPPEAVLEATNDYLEDEDTLGSWIKECCLVGKEATKKKPAKASALFESWKAWCQSNNAEWTSIKKFGPRLMRVPGVNRKKENDGNYYTGIALRDALTESDDFYRPELWPKD
ncbi:MAG: bifunctional DNA primase/polymerase [Rhodospirillaceae bacterium]|nr:bifunctional DNA primase/polymerase [Rhodospirillaceae bacterium]